MNENIQGELINKLEEIRGRVATLKYLNKMKQYKEIDNLIDTISKLKDNIREWDF